MQKYKGVYPATLFLILSLSLALSIGVSAEGVKDGAENSGIQQNDTRNLSGLSGEVGNKNDNEGNEAIDIEATSSENGSGGDNGQGDEHKSRVATIVRGLLFVADREGGIGDDVRRVAQEQASTSDKVKEDMDGVNGESSLKKFFFGPNFKNLGDLRSTIVTTQNHIERLKRVEERMASTSMKSSLSVQVSELQKVASSTRAFIDANEGKFSMFGWFIKLFSK